MTLEENSYSANLGLTQKEIETEYPLAVKLKQEQENFLTIAKKEYFENLENIDINTNENLEISTTINKSLELDVDGLLVTADKAVTQYEDITKEQLTVVLLQSIASTNESRLMRKVAKKLIKKVGK